MFEDIIAKTRESYNVAAACADAIVAVIGERKGVLSHEVSERETRRFMEIAGGEDYAHYRAYVVEKALENNR